jgi:hypothetical protein
MTRTRRTFYILLCLVTLCSGVNWVLELWIWIVHHHLLWIIHNVVIAVLPLYLIHNRILRSPHISHALYTKPISTTTIVGVVAATRLIFLLLHSEITIRIHIVRMRLRGLLIYMIAFASTSSTQNNWLEKLSLVARRILMWSDWLAWSTRRASSTTRACSSIVLLIINLI